MSAATEGQTFPVESSVAEQKPTADIAVKALATKKLHGRAFYESLGSPRFVLAPMVDQSEFVLHPYISCKSHTDHIYLPKGMAAPYSLLHEALESPIFTRIHTYVALPHVQ